MAAKCAHCGRRANLDLIEVIGLGPIGLMTRRLCSVCQDEFVEWLNLKRFEGTAKPFDIAKDKPKT